MNINEATNDSDWNLAPLKKEIKTEVEKKKQIYKKENRKFCERWVNIFSPWLSRCYDDPNRPFCRACQRPLDNNRFRLQRHERTAKHARNQEVLLNEGEDAVRLLLSRTKKRKNIKKDTFSDSFTFDSKLENEIPVLKCKPLKAIKPQSDNKNDLDTDYMSPKRDYNDMNNYYYSPQISRTPVPQPKKDSFDLFFEAMSATVKSLPPKLAAEVKSRISQVIAEFELRAICEKEAQEKAKQTMVSMPAHVTSVVTIDPVITSDPDNVNTHVVNESTGQCAPTVTTQYVYSYQQKKEIN